MVNKSCFETNEFSQVSSICNRCKLFKECGNTASKIKKEIVKKKRFCKAIKNNGTRCLGIVFVDDLCFNHWRIKNRNKRNGN